MGGGIKEGGWMWRVKEEGRERLRLGVGGAAKRKGKGSKGMENEEWRGKNRKDGKMWGYCSRADGVREAVWEMLPEMLEPAACVKNHTATFLILDITDRLSKHTQCAFKVHGCNIQIFTAASPLRSYSFVFLPSVNTADVRGIKFNQCCNS